MNIQSALRQACVILRDNNIKTANLDSEILMSYVIRKDKKYITLNHNKKLLPKNISNFKKLIFQRASGKPIAYLMGKKDFWNYEFIVTSDVLIPRLETELIVEQVLKIGKNKSKLNILEIGVGSGGIIL